jgi:hypothetical protein
MNLSYKQVSALVFSAIVTTSAFGMENANVTDIITEQSSSAWYKKGSVQVAAAAVTLAVVGYACAVRMGKVALPALITGLVAVKTVQESTPEESAFVNNDVSEQTVVVEQNQEQDQVVVQMSKEVEQTNSFNGVVNNIKNVIENTLKNLTQEDLERIDQELVR